MKDSILERKISFSELIELELLKELAESAVRVHGLSLKIFDENHQQMLSVGPTQELVTWLLRHPSARIAFSDFANTLKRAIPEADGWRVMSDPVAGSRYLVLAIVYDLDFIGTLICGPYQDSMKAPKIQERYCPKVSDRAHLMALCATLPQSSDEFVRIQMELFLKSLDVICYSNHQSILTRHMHLESISESYRELEETHHQLEEKNQKLEQNNIRLKELDRLKNNFLATVSHELRTPLTSMIGYSEMLLGGLAGELNPEQREYITTIQNRGSGLLRLIERALDPPKIEQGFEALHYEQLQARTLVLEALESIKPQALKAQVSLHLKFSTGVSSLEGDRYKIVHALINLLSNAVKFSSKGGEIIISATQTLSSGEPHRSGDWICFGVQDRGLGIAKDQQEQIFKAFYQVNGQEYGGTGLGLSIVKSFVEIHGGQVELKSALGEGAHFRLLFPQRRRH